jgi:hypothetical protein
MSWLTGGHLLLRNFGPYVTLFMNVRFTVVGMVMLLKGFWALLDNIYKSVSHYNCYHGNAV